MKNYVLVFLVNQFVGIKKIGKSFFLQRKFFVKKTWWCKKLFNEKSCLVEKLLLGFLFFIFLRKFVIAHFFNDLFLVEENYLNKKFLMRRKKCWWRKQIK